MDSLMSHAFETVKRDNKTDGDEAHQNNRCGIAQSDILTVKQSRSNSSTSLHTLSSNNLLYMYSRRHQSRTDTLAQELVETRQNIINLLLQSDSSMSFDEKRQCEWDLFLVHGILEFGYSATQLRQSIALMQKHGMDPQDYSAMESIPSQPPSKS